MKGIFLKCPGCKKMLMKNAYLRPGSFLSTRCYHCGILVDIKAQDSKIIMQSVKEPIDLTDDEDNGIIFIHN